MDNKVLIFSAPSGSGKSTIVNHILGIYPDSMEFSVSATSRPQADNHRQDYDNPSLSPVTENHTRVSHKQHTTTDLAGAVCQENSKYLEIFF